MQPTETERRSVVRRRPGFEQRAPGQRRSGKDRRAATPRAPGSLVRALNSVDACLSLIREAYQLDPTIRAKLLEELANLAELLHRTTGSAKLLS